MRDYPPEKDSNSDGQGHAGQASPEFGEVLPPVEPPSAKFLVQLFLIPGLLVAVLVGLVWLFFGWLAPGSYEPQDFLKGLRSNHDPVRWRTAQDLAQILPRKEALRLDVGFALDLALLLEEELNREPANTAASDPGRAPHLAEFLPAALGHFHVPVGVPVLCRLIREHARQMEYLDGGSDPQSSRLVNVAGLRVRNSLVALANSGARLRELDTLAEEEQQKVVQQLRMHAEREGRVGELARLAEEYMQARRSRRTMGDSTRQDSPLSSGTRPKLVEQLYDALAVAVNCDDEMSRKFACMALANWPDSELESLLLSLLNVDEPPRLLESTTPRRAVLEIQYNAALALLRRQSSRTPWRLIEELLDESVLAQRYSNDSPQGYDAAAVHMATLATLRTLYDVEREQPGFIRQQQNILFLVQKLQASSNTAVQVEARRILGTESVSGRPARRVSRELLLLIGVGLGVGILLLVAVIARWKRHEPGVFSGSTDVSSSPAS